jgi:hypothetical protein
MISLLFALLLVQAPSGSTRSTSASPPFQLAPGEYRHLEFTVRQVPTEVECKFHVLDGDDSVGLELLPRSELVRYELRREHVTLAVFPPSRDGAIRLLVNDPGRYVVAVKNRREARTATVTMELATDVNPNSDVVAQELPPAKRMAVIAISFLMFFSMVAFSGYKLLRALPRGR